MFLVGILDFETALCILRLAAFWLNVWSAISALMASENECLVNMEEFVLVFLSNTVILLGSFYEMINC